MLQFKRQKKKREQRKKQDSFSFVHNTTSSFHVQVSLDLCNSDAEI